VVAALTARPDQVRLRGCPPPSPQPRSSDAPLGADPRAGYVQYRVKAFLEALAQLGWTEGRNLRIDYRLPGSKCVSSDLFDHLICED
jgi:hypothetical protein